MNAGLISALLCLGAGCRTVATSAIASATDHDPRVGTRARTWEVRCGGEARGLVVLFHEDGRVRDSLYLVQNLYHQDLGLIDGLGRAYRYLPHHEEPAWVGSGTILSGAQDILDVALPCELVELSDHESRPVPGSAPAGPRDPEERTNTGTLGPVGTSSPGGGLPQSR